MKLFTRGIFIVLISILMVSGTTGCSSSKIESSQLEVGLQFGYDDTIKIFANNPLVATIKNNGPAFTGELKIQVEDNMNGKVMYAMPFEIAENAQKEISMSVPIYTIQKDFNVSITSGKRNLYDDKVRVLKVLSPNQAVMAVITDTPDAYRFLENTKTAYVKDEYYEKTMSMYSSKTVTTEVYTPIQTEELNVVYFDNLEDLDSIEKLSYFNYIYMGHSQSLTISKEEEEALTAWIEQGNFFVVETGSDYKKMNSILPSNLNPIPIDYMDKVEITNIYNDIRLDKSLDIAISNSLDDKSFVRKDEGGAVLAAATKKGSGTIITLMVNMGLEPLASWNKKSPFISTLLQEVSQQNNNNININYGGSAYKSMLNQVPTDKKTPYMMIFMVFLIYIIVVAPISYFILKKLDKRDFAWIGIPILAFICIAVLYIFGGNTRYNTAITNSISILTANENDQVMNITTDMVILNNNKDKLVVEWDADEEINFNNMEQMYYRSYYDTNNEVEKKLNGKFTLGNPEKYENYNTSLWASSYLTASKTIPFNHEEDMIYMEIDGNNAKITVKNITPYILENAFIQWGQGYIYIGNLDPGQEKQDSINLDKLKAELFETFIGNEMGIKQIDYDKKVTSTEMKMQRQFEFLMRRYVYDNYNSNQLVGSIDSFDNVKLCAVNHQVVGYDLMINGNTTQDYATNIIEIESKIQFDSGADIQIPEGIILPYAEYYLDDRQTGGTFDYQANDQFLRFFEEGIAQFTFYVPKAIKLSSAVVTFEDVYGEKDYYNSRNGVSVSPKEGVTYSAYNVFEGVWEEVSKEIKLGDKYVDSNGRIQVRVDLRSMTNQKAQIDGYSYTQMMKLPTISMKGRVE